MYSHKAVDTFDQFLYNYVLNHVAPNVTQQLVKRHPTLAYFILRYPQIFGTILLWLQDFDELDLQKSSVTSVFNV